MSEPAEAATNEQTEHTEHAKEEKGASKVALARRYVEATREMLYPSVVQKTKGPPENPDERALEFARNIVTEIVKTLQLPPLSAKQVIIESKQEVAAHPAVGESQTGKAGG